MPQGAPQLEPLLMPQPMPQGAPQLAALGLQAAAAPGPPALEDPSAPLSPIFDDFVELWPWFQGPGGAFGPAAAPSVVGEAGACSSELAGACNGVLNDDAAWGCDGATAAAATAAAAAPKAAASATAAAPAAPAGSDEAEASEDLLIPAERNTYLRWLGIEGCYFGEAASPRLGAVRVPAAKRARLLWARGKAALPSGGGRPHPPPGARGGCQPTASAAQGGCRRARVAVSPCQAAQRRGFAAERARRRAQRRCGGAGERALGSARGCAGPLGARLMFCSCACRLVQLF